MGDSWHTPTWLLDLIFGGQEYFDPCAANPDGLRSFDGRGAWPTDKPVFLNPPYSDPGPWLERAAKHPGPIVCLVKLDPSTLWWQMNVGGFRVVLVGQRLRFLNGSGGTSQSADFPSAFWMKAWPPRHGPAAIPLGPA